MEDLIKFIIALILLTVIYIYIDKKKSGLVYVRSNIDNNVYLVRNVEDKQNAANLLASIVQKINKLIDYLTKKYPSDSRVIRLKRNFNPSNIEESESGSKYTSYSYNKGQKIVFCIRSKDKFANLEDENIIMFVALHEISHLATKSLHHTPEFWENFSFILKESIKLGIYKRLDFKRNPEKYCGVMINSTPV